MPNEDQATSVNQGYTATESGWLLQPTWERNLFGEIAEAKRMTPEVLGAIEAALTESQEEPPMYATNCQPLTKCGTFDGSGPDHPCPGLKECDKFTGTAITGERTGTRTGIGGSEEGELERKKRN